MGKISNYLIFLITICILGIIVITKTTMKINEHHEERLLYSLESTIKYHAKKCYLENKCNGEITLDYLYQNNILEELINPVTKEILDHDIKINYIDNEIIIYWK